MADLKFIETHNVVKVDDLKFVETHNVVVRLVDPPLSHQEFKSMVLGLNNLRITHAIRENPFIYKKTYG